MIAIAIMSIDQLRELIDNDETPHDDKILAKKHLAEELYIKRQLSAARGLKSKNPLIVPPYT